MEYRYLLVQRETAICRLTLNRPERLNALNVRIGVELLDALEECDRDA
ncbi:MAG: enoyl-CoA hydratase, partial [Deltaproteobacteria bacterium]|nr:enoyl-CoA hydratase [Deltaproteobacteria bacterium]